nr:MAG TPA: hypothetical protein [Caudoviricetes sp.]
MKYSDMTIEEAEIIQKHIQCEIIFNGDNKEIIFNNIMEEFINNFKEGLLNILKEVYKVAEAIGNTIAKIITTTKEYIIKLFDKKISKKRFMKLLQSKGMQRNEINHIVKNNKDKYTLWRYFINIPPTIKDKKQK